MCSMAVAGLSLEALLKECGVPTEVGTHLSKLNIKSTNLFATLAKTIDDVVRYIVNRVVVALGVEDALPDADQYHPRG